MKLHLFALILLLGGIQNSTTGEGTIEGRVLRAGSGEPLANTPVTLISSAGLSDTALASLLDQISQLVTIGLQGGGGGGSQDLTIRQVTNVLQTAGPGVGVQASVLTDRAGHFAFTNLPRGRYTVWVQRFNYYGPLRNGFPTSTTSVTLAFDPSSPPPPVDLVLTQGMAIAGRVLTARGQPALNMGVTAYRSTFSEGKPVWSPVLTRPIDDRGEYRLSPLAPGEYYVGVTPPQTALAPTGQDPSVRTFFPGVTEPSQATKLILKLNDVAGVDFSLRTAPSTLFKITGIAVNPAGTPSPTGIVDHAFNSFTLMPLESNLVDSLSPGTFPNVVAAANRAAGEFEIRNVRPGIYELYPLFMYSGFLSGRTIVDVRNADALGVRVIVNPIVSLQGRVVIAEASPQRPVKLDSIRIVLKPLNAPPVRGSGPIPVTVQEGGQFAIAGPAGALAALQVSGLPDTAFISEIRMGNTSVFDSGLELSSSTEPVQIVIDATTGGTVEMIVRTADERPAPRATIVLVPAEDRRQNPMRYKTGTTDNDGRLIVRGVAPGSYTAFAWESIPETAWLNKEFLSKYQELGTAVTIAPGTQMNLQLKWIPFDADLR